MPWLPTVIDTSVCQKLWYVSPNGELAHSSAMRVAARRKPAASVSLFFHPRLGEALRERLAGEMDGVMSVMIGTIDQVQGWCGRSSVRSIPSVGGPTIPAVTLLRTASQRRPG